MSKRKELSVDLRDRIILLHKQRMSQRQIANHLNISKTAVQYNLNKFKETGSTKNMKRSGRPRKTSWREDKQLRDLCKANRSDSASELLRKWKKKVSEKTVRRRLNSMGYLSRKAKTKPFISKSQAKKRLTWARKHEMWNVDDWKNVIFSDETRICIGFGDNVGQRVRRKPNEKFHKQCLKSSVKFPQGVMIWGCIGSRGTGSICILNRTMNTEVYVDVLEHKLLPTVEKYFGDGNFIFQQDNASCHKSNNSKKWLEENNVPVLEWPANSPDMNPIESLWNILKRNVRNKAPQTLGQLKEDIVSCWNEIPSDTCAKLIEQMPRRIKALIKAKGGPTKY